MLRFRNTLRLLLVLTSLLFVVVPAFSDELPHVVVFYRDGCNDCRHMDELLEGMQAEYPALVVTHIEESEAGAADLMWTLAAEYGIFPSAFPVIFAGDAAVTGIGREKDLRLRSAIRTCMLSGCETPMERIQQTAFPWLTLATIAVALLVVAILLL